MKRPMVSIRDLETNKRIIREMNDEEFAQWEIDQARATEDERQREAKEKDRRNKSKKLVKGLAKLVDLTENEIAELLRLDIEDD